MNLSNHRSKGLFVLQLVLLFALSFAAGPATAQASDPVLGTHFSLLIGHPNPDEPSPAGVLVVPGMVLPLDSPDDPALLEDVTSRSLEVADVAERLRETIRLGEVRVQYQVQIGLRAGKERALPVSQPDDLQILATALGFNDDLATYRIVMQKDGEILADAKVSIERGDRAVVGGLNGDDAPYVFVIVEPSRPGDPLSVDPEGGISPPQRLEAVAPQYTEEARKARTQGVVIVQAIIGTDGLIRSTKVLRSLDPGLDTAATEAIKQWRFAPATLDGEPVAVYYNLTINFRLDSEKNE